MKINFHYAASAMITLFAAAVISSCGTTGKTATSGNIGSTTTHNSATTGHNQTGKPVQNKPAKVQPPHLLMPPLKKSAGNGR